MTTQSPRTLRSRWRGTVKKQRAALLGALVASCLAGVSPSAQAADTMPWLRTDGPRIVDEKGKTLVLGGPNLGSWLVEEMWMMPFETKAPEGSGFAGIKDRTVLWKTIEKRFGTEEMRRIRTALRNAWITEADFDRVRAGGMNCVRLPFTYDLLEEPDGWTWIDRCVDWAAKRGLYVILDLHGAPGRQSSSDHTGESDVNKLFKDPEMVRRTEEIWKKIAQRYKDRPEVAGYDLLNEPMGAADPVSLYIISDRLYRAVRSVDSRHMIFIEDGYKGKFTFPKPASVGWDNVVLSWHHYNFGAKSEQDQLNGALSAAADGRKLQYSHAAPFYMGEFQFEPHGTPAVLGAALKALQQNGSSWSNWTYKAVMKDGSGGMWGWYRARQAPKVLNPFTDSAAELLQKIEQVRTENLSENKEMTAAFQAAARVAPLPPPREVIPTSQKVPQTWRYATEKPADNWFAVAFNDSGWKEGKGGFGADWTPPTIVHTRWNTPDIWLRREFTLPEGAAFSNDLWLRVCHDDDGEVYINGVLAAKLPRYTTDYEEVDLTPEGKAALKPGKNILAVRCHQTIGGQFIDVGIVGVAPEK